MAVPKRKTSKTKKRQRSAHKAIRVPNLASCSRCNQPVLPHRVCGNCGYYGRRKVIEVEEA
ncbi:MAG: 50S ribosomal protein L32 [Planctomycetota bacterium]